MRKLSEISAPILPSQPGRVPSERRRVRAVFDSLTAMVLFKHGENETQLFVSDDDDATGAVWIPKQPVLLDTKDRGRFLVVTMTRTAAQRHGFALRILDRNRYLPEERAMLDDAVEVARNKRFRFSGQSNNRPTWSGGRHVYA